MNPEKALPGYKSLADAQKEANETAEKQLAVTEQTNILLTSLILYHGNPEDDKGWLERINMTQLCEKKNTKQHRSKTFSVLFVIVSATVAIEFVSTGTVNGLDVAWTIIKGLFT